jgi:aminoglycoside phosphotransferase (APT) family kinase protein
MSGRPWIPLRQGLESRHPVRHRGRVDEVEVVIAHQSRATVRVGNLFLKIDPDVDRMDREVEAMTVASAPTPRVVWRHPPVLALAALQGAPLGRLGQPSTASPAAWRAAGAAVRMLHETPLPSWPSQRGSQRGSTLDEGCAWLLANEVVEPEVLDANRELALVALRERKQVFVHGDLHVAHVFVRDDQVTGILD